VSKYGYKRKLKNHSVSGFDELEHFFEQDVSPRWIGPHLLAGIQAVDYQLHAAQHYLILSHVFKPFGTQKDAFIIIFVAV